MEVTSQAPAASANTQPVQPADAAKAQAQDPKKAVNQPAAPAPSASALEKDAANQGNAALRKFKLKVDGKEHEVDEAEVIRRAQMSTAAEKRFDEAEQRARVANELFQKLQTDPFSVIDDPRLKLTKEQKVAWVEKWYRENVIEPETLTPEQRELKAAQAKIKSFEENEKKKAQAEEQARLQALERHHAQTYDKLVTEALQVEGVPKTPQAVSRMADLLMKNIRLGLELTPAQIATIVREDFVAEQMEIFKGLEGDALLKMFGDDVINRIRKADLERIRAGIPNLPKPVLDAPKADTQTKSKAQWKSIDEEREERERRVAALAATWGKK